VAGDHATAIAYLDESIALARRSGDPITLGKALYPRAVTAEEVGDHVRQVALFEEMLRLPRNRDATYWITEALLGLGRAARGQGDFGRDRVLHEEALALARERECALSMAWATTGLAEGAAEVGEIERAATLFRESVRLHAAHGNHYGTDFCLLGLAKLAVAGGRFEAAAWLLGAAEALRDSRGELLPLDHRASHDACVVAVRSCLGEDAFTTAWATGRALSIEDAVNEALRIESPQSATSANASASLGLTRREREVLRLVAEGQTDRAIAAALTIGERTVEWHLTNAFNKLGVSTRAAAAAAALRRGLI
jgi:non-specific serine/threonine protein kinase